MATVTVKCSCCSETYEVEVHETCSKSCGATMRERRRRSLSNRKVINAKAFLSMPRVQHESQ